MVFTEIDATEYLDDLWSRHGPHLHIHISKFEEVCIYDTMYSRHSFIALHVLYEFRWMLKEWVI